MSDVKLTNSFTRRRFLTDTAGVLCGVGLLGVGLGLYTQKAKGLPASALRPPGAIDEETFTGACIRCGLCVRGCPYDTLRLAKLNEDIPTGTPYYYAREIPCEMCEEIPCIKACPTGALNPSLTKIDEARMGLAVLVDQETCLNFQGLRCDVCYDICPLIEHAITLEVQHNIRSGKHALFIPTIHSDYCTGCGKCEYGCVLPESAIKVFPLHLAKGLQGEHYRFGWQEKEKAGGSLVGKDEAHQYHLPKDMEYEHKGKGLIRKENFEPPAKDNGQDHLQGIEKELQQ